MTDHVLIQGYLRVWLQPDGPGNVRYFSGESSQEIAVSGARLNRRGANDPVYRHDPLRPGQFVKRGQRTTAPDSHTLTLDLAETCGGIHRADILDTPFTLYELASCCGDPGDFLRGWDWIKIYSGIHPEAIDFNDRTALVSSDEITVSIEAEADDIYDVSKLYVGATLFGTPGNATQEIVAGFFLCYEQCKCGPPRGAADWFYAVTSDGGMVRWTKPTGWMQWSVQPTTDAVVLDAFYNDNSQTMYMLVSNLYNGTGPATDGYVSFKLDEDGAPDFDTYELFTALTGAVGMSPWLDGFLAVTGNDLAEVTEPGAAAETIYTAPQALALVETYADQFIVMGGNAGGIYRKRGVAVATIASPTTDPITAIEIVTEYRWYIGTSTGSVFVTRDGGISWNPVAYGSTGSSVRDIKFPTDEVGYIMSGGIATFDVFATWDGGYAWTKRGPRITNASSLYTPAGADSGVLITPSCGTGTERANALMFGGMPGTNILAGATLEGRGMGTATLAPVPLCYPWTVGVTRVESCDWIIS